MHLNGGKCHFTGKHCRNGQMEKILFVSSLPKVGLRAMHKNMDLSI